MVRLKHDFLNIILLFLVGLRSTGERLGWLNKDFCGYKIVRSLTEVASHMGQDAESHLLSLLLKQVKLTNTGIIRFSSTIWRLRHCKDLSTLDRILILNVFFDNRGVPHPQAHLNRLVE
jgi:hypothetical protein